MAIIGHSPDELFEKLYRHENFGGYAFRAREADFDAQQPLPIPRPLQLNASQKSASTRRSQLQTRLAPDKLPKRLDQVAAIGQDSLGVLPHLQPLEVIVMMQRSLRSGCRLQNARRCSSRADRNLDQIRSSGRNGRLESRRNVRCSIDSLGGDAH